jgi:hypothetical protein
MLWRVQWIGYTPFLGPQWTEVGCVQKVYQSHPDLLGGQMGTARMTDWSAAHGANNLSLNPFVDSLIFRRPAGLNSHLVNVVSFLINN